MHPTRDTTALMYLNLVGGRVMPGVMPLPSMNSWRITKYNPAFRDERGAYLRDEWTSVSDVGDSFGGVILDFGEYRRVEDAYISTALRFVAEADLDALTITCLETHRAAEARAKDLGGTAFDPKRARTGMSLPLGALGDVCRLVLREILWCKLEAAGGFYLHFGYDYYMYVGSPARSENSIAYARQQGLFVEEMESPYLDAAEA